MSSWLPSFPYPPAGDGYWTPVTSTINWCEEDYYATYYSAEIVNTLTNIWFIYLAYRGIRMCIVHDHDRVFLYAYVSYLMIGVGSFIFHSTLKYPMQLLDELSMIYTTCIMFFATFEHGRSPKSKVALAGLTASIAMFVTGYYHYLGDPTFHQNTFTTLTLIVFLRSVYAMEMALRPGLRKIDHALIPATEVERRNERDKYILRQMWILIPMGLGSVGAGHIVWRLDGIYCSQLRSWRRQIGLPYGILLEGHGWWHLLAGIAEYMNLVWSIWLRYCLDGRQDEVELVWPSIWLSIPKIVRKKQKMR